MAVEGGLGVGGFIGFVVAVFSVAVHVDEDVFVEFLAVFEGEFHGHNDGEGVIAVDVEDGGFEHFGDIGAVDGGAGVFREGGEADLVIDDEVEGAAGAVAFEFGEVEGFCDDALSDDGGVAVDEDGEDFGAVDIDDVFGEEALAGAGFAFDDGVDGFEMAWVSGECDIDFVACFGGVGIIVTEVVFDITVAVDAFGDIIFCKFFKDKVIGFAHDVGEDVEAAAVGHAHDDGFYAHAWAFFDNGVEGWDEGFGAFEGEAFLADVAGMEEAFEDFCLVNFAEDADAFFFREVGLVEGGFDMGLEPVAFGHVLDMHVFATDGTAVGLIKAVDNFFCGEHFSVEVVVGEEFFGEVVGFEAELGIA